MNLDFVFNSSDHLRYENGKHISGPHGGAARAIQVEPNINGCEGYDIRKGDGYIVTIYNLDGKHPLWNSNVQITPKPMRIISQSSEKVVLRGYQVKAMSPLGWIDFNGADYGLTIFFKNEYIEKCVLHMYDKNVDIEYLKVEEEIYDSSELGFYVINQQNFNNMINYKTQFRIWEEEIPDNTFMNPYKEIKTGKYHFMFQTEVTEKMVGISDDNIVYNIHWELLREEAYKDKKFLVFCGWGDQNSTGVIGGLPQFNYYEIGVDKRLFASLLSLLISTYPVFFSLPKIRNVIGFEGFKFEDGQIIMQ